LLLSIGIVGLIVGNQMPDRRHFDASDPPGCGGPSCHQTLAGAGGTAEHPPMRTRNAADGRTLFGALTRQRKLR
jgi:hypothetical protein